jgi:hypothetical protein
MKRSKELAIYDRRVISIKDGRFVQEICPEQIRVMVRCEGYAMVRHKGAIPFVVSERDLRQVAHGYDTQGGLNGSPASTDDGQMNEGNPHD